MFGQNEIVGKKFFAAEVSRAAAEGGPRLMVTSVFFTLQGEGPYSGRPAVFVRLSKCNLACNFCFPAHYEITTKFGKKRLDNVRIGDWLPTLDDNLAPTYTQVVAKNNRWVPVDNLVQVRYRKEEGGSVRTRFVTKEHPFNVKDRGFVNAGDLKPGMIVHNFTGAEGTSLRMTHRNPMRVTSVRLAAHNTLRERISTGSVKPYVRDAEWRENQAKNMRVNNPMHLASVVRKVTSKKTYRKSTLEKAVHSIFRKLGTKVEFTGTKPKWLIGDDKHGYMRPDFWVKGTNKVIDVYDRGYPYYTDKRHTHEGEKAYKTSRRKHFVRFGYKVHFLTAQDLKLRGWYKTCAGSGFDLQNAEYQVNKILTNGAEIVSVSAPKTSSINSPFTKTGTYKDGKVKVVNFTCHPHNTYCMDGLHTHNCDTFFDAGDWKTFPEIELLIEEAVRGYFEEQKVPGGVPAWALNASGPALGAPEITLHSGIILVITGGEPLLQDHITAFCKTQLKRFAAIQVESNGIADTELPSGVKLVCSPKCSEKNGKAVAYLKPSNTIIARADCLKFVISADAESPYHTIPDWAFEWRHRNPWKPIYVSPMNVYNTMPQKAKLLRLSKDGKSLPTMEERSTVDEVVSFWEEGLLNKEANQKNHEYAARYCMTHNLRFNLQTHLFASLA